MRFTEDSLRNLGRSDKKIEQLASRQRGGETGASGYEYQRRFAIFRVLELAARNDDGEVHVEGLCPVDDVVVESAGHHEHSQVKESPTETWGKKNGKLQKEFRAQAALLRDAKATRYSLQIVTPHAHRAAHFAKVPKGLKRVTRARLFPHPTLAHQPWTVPDIAQHLETILVVDALSGPSQREYLWAAVDHACGNPWIGRKAVDVVRLAGDARKDLPIRDPIRATTVAQADIAAACAITSAIPQLDVRIVDGVCFFVFAAGVERRFIARTDDDAFKRFLERILQKRPQDFDAFYAELP